MNPSIILGCYIVYLLLGRLILIKIDIRLFKWLYNAPNMFLFLIAYSIWPIIIIVYYLKGKAAH